MLRRLLTIALLAIAFISVSFTPVAMAADVGAGVKVFKANCAACHMGGRNTVVANKTLKKEALQEYGMYSADKIIYQVTNGKNAMPAFGERLSETDIENVAAYVLEQAEAGWPKSSRRRRRR